jgi:hypothetical protein
MEERSCNLVEILDHCLPELTGKLLKTSIRISGHNTRIQNFSLNGNDFEAIYNLCMILKIVL